MKKGIILVAVTTMFGLGVMISQNKADELNNVDTDIIETEIIGEEVSNENNFKYKNTLNVEKVAEYDSNTRNDDGGVTEIIEYNKDNNKIYSINGKNQTIEIISLDNLDATNYQELTLEKSINIKEYVEVDGFIYGDITSIDVNTEKQIVACAVQEDDYSKNGKIVVLDYDGNLIETYECGVQPDMVKITSDGRFILSADEGEPRKGLVDGVDPEGSVTIVSLEDNIVKKVLFDDESVIDDDVHIRNKEGGAKLDFEPEYMDFNSTNNLAYVALQENNAIATIDIPTGNVIGVKSLGLLDHSTSGIDLGRDDEINIDKFPAFGMRMPDGISYLELNGKEYILTANEGDATEREEFVNIADFKDFKDQIEIDYSKFEVMTEEEINAKFEEMKNDESFDKLEVLTDMGNDGIYLLGSRSFSIFDAQTMELVFDSNDDFEQITAERYPKHFNSSHNKDEMDGRSTKKGPEPENVVVGEVDGKNYAFVGLERIGGIMTYDISDPINSKFVNYINTRDFSDDQTGDLAPEGMTFIPKEDNKTGYALLVVANEVSGTISVQRIGDR
ncbi:MAG: choice-of-anchor I family protein [Peptostreptococcaceae bacterium]